jgi:hypothetical protein
VLYFLKLTIFGCFFISSAYATQIRKDSILFKTDGPRKPGAFKDKLPGEGPAWPGTGWKSKNLIEENGATKAGLTKALKDYIATKPKPGSQLLLGIEAHGNHKTPHEIVGLDSDFSLSDREILSQLERIKKMGVKIGIIADSCYGGQVVKDLGDLGCIISSTTPNSLGLGQGLATALHQILKTKSNQDPTSASPLIFKDKRTLADVLLYQTVIPSRKKNGEWIGFQSIKSHGFGKAELDYTEITPALVTYFDPTATGFTSLDSVQNIRETFGISLTEDENDGAVPYFSKSLWEFDPTVTSCSKTEKAISNETQLIGTLIDVRNQVHKDFLNEYCTYHFGAPCGFDSIEVNLKRIDSTYSNVNAILENLRQNQKQIADAWDDLYSMCKAMWIDLKKIKNPNISINQQIINDINIDYNRGTAKSDWTLHDGLLKVPTPCFDKTGSKQKDISMILERRLGPMDGYPDAVTYEGEDDIQLDRYRKNKVTIQEGKIKYDKIQAEYHNAVYDIFKPLKELSAYSILNEAHKPGNPCSDFEL